MTFLFTGVACGPENSAAPGTEALAKETEPLYLTAAKWPGGVVPMCWDTTSYFWPNFPTVARIIRDSMNNSWPTVANVEFVGWGPCTDNGPAGSVRIILKSGSGNHVRPFIGYEKLFQANMTIDPTDWRFPNVVMPHEAGHVLGFNHEFTRPDFGNQTATDDSGASFPCNQTDTINGGNTLDTAPDPQSQLASTYCGNRTELSVWDAVGAINAYGARQSAVRPIVTAFSWDRLDNVTVSAPDGIASVKDVPSYFWTYGNGWVFTREGAPGTIPLKLYWSDASTDNVTLASSATESAVSAAGYRYIRTEGYVFSSQQPGTVALNQYYHSGNQDYILTTPGRSENDAIAAGYGFVRTEGYISEKVPYSLLWTYSSAKDNVMTGQNSNLAGSLDGQGYSYSGFEGAAWNFPIPGTALVKNFLKIGGGWGAGFHDHFTLAHASSEATATASSYSRVTTEYSGSPGGREAYVYTSPWNPPCSGWFCFPATVSLVSYKHPTSLEFWTTVTRGTQATNAGYQTVRTEGHVIPVAQ